MPFEEFEQFSCPYCGQENNLLVDLSAGQQQEMVVDCDVCCAPIVVRLKIRGQEIISLDVQREND